MAANKKVPVTIRLDAETVAAFKATGEGWQTRVNHLLAHCAPKDDKGRRVEFGPKMERVQFVGIHHGSVGKASRRKLSKTGA